MQNHLKALIARLALGAALLGLIAACGGGGGGGGTPDTTPVARAGADQTVLANSVVYLDGSASSNASTYIWTLTPPGGSAATLSNPAVYNPTFTADIAGIYTLSLVVNNGTVNSSPDTVTVTAVNPVYIPDTGQAVCYSAAGTIIACNGSGQDGEYNTIGQPSYAENTAGIITDTVTGLMWQKCTMGESGTDCATGTAGSYNWYQASGTADTTSNPGGAINACGGTILGYSDWRLPTDFELTTLIDYSGTYDPYAINTTFFPGTEPARYWSSTTRASMSSTTSAWYAIFATDTSVATTLKTDPGRVRCVRGAPSARFFTDNGNTVSDVVAGLMWQKQDDGTTKTWTNAISYCDGLSLGGKADWRLPNVKELRSIVDTTENTPAVNETYFPGTQLQRYWSSTTDVTITSQAWTIEFIAGVTGVMSKAATSLYYARCVRSLP